MSNQLTKATATIPNLIKVAEYYLETSTDEKEIENLKYWIAYFKQQQQILESK